MDLVSESHGTTARTQRPERRAVRFWNEAGIAYYFSHRDAIRAERAPLPGG